jgi:hypothetical protein
MNTISDDAIIPQRFEIRVVFDGLDTSIEKHEQRHRRVFATVFRTTGVVVAVGQATLGIGEYAPGLTASLPGCQ